MEVSWYVLFVYLYYLYSFTEAYEMTDGVKVICQSELTTDVELTFPEEVVRVMSSFVEDFKTIGRPIII